MQSHDRHFGASLATWYAPLTLLLCRWQCHVRSMHLSLMEHSLLLQRSPKQACKMRCEKHAPQGHSCAFMQNGGVEQQPGFKETVASKQMPAFWHTHSMCCALLVLCIKISPKLHDTATCLLVSVGLCFAHCLLLMLHHVWIFLCASDELLAEWCAMAAPTCNKQHRQHVHAELKCWTSNGLVTLVMLHMGDEQ